MDGFNTGVNGPQHVKKMGAFRRKIVGRRIADGRLVLFFLTEIIDLVQLNKQEAFWYSLKAQLHSFYHTNSTTSNPFTSVSIPLPTI